MYQLLFVWSAYDAAHYCKCIHARRIGHYRLNCILSSARAGHRQRVDYISDMRSDFS